MFKNILVPISSEYYTKNELKRSIFLAETFQSTVHILYIIEQSTMQQMDKFSDTHLTFYNRTQTHQKIAQKQRTTAETIIREEIQPLFDKKNISMKYSFSQGAFSTSVQNQIKKNGYDLVLMSYEKQCMIDYRFIDKISIPIWIEGGGHHTSILAICSNLAPNQQVPLLSKNLAKAFQWNLSMLYIIDTQDNVEVDSTGHRSVRKPLRDLEFTGQTFAEEMKEKNITVKTVQGSIEQQTIKEAKKIKAGLVIIGREQKQKGMLGLPVKNTKQKIAEKCKYSILFLN